MSNVTLNIGGRDYTVACDAGEETHIGELGQMIDAKLGTIPTGTPQNDARALLFAALLLADELYELQRSGTGHAKADPVPLPDDIAPPEQLDALAMRLEALVAALEVPA